MKLSDLKRITYKDLIKIKEPILLFVLSDNLDLDQTFISRNRVRILYPDGQCSYFLVRNDWYARKFQRSCFTSEKFNLKETVRQMENYDFAETELYIIPWK